MKKLLKKLLIPILASPQVTRIAHRLFNCGIPIFMLHRIAEENVPAAGKTDPHHLRQCLNYLRDNNYTFISLESLLLALKNNKPAPPKSIVFTMDDGYIDQAEKAAPIFLEYNCPLTFFVITGMLDQTIWPWDAQTAWIIESAQQQLLASSNVIKNLDITFDQNTSKRKLRQLVQGALKEVDADSIPDTLQQLANEAGVTMSSSPPPPYQAMTWDMARNLETQGIRFAPHSVNHNILSRLNQHSMVQEIEQTWQVINRELTNPLKIFCYPNGRKIDFGSREIEVLKNTGYLGAVSTTPDFVMTGKKHYNQLYSLPRLALPDNMTDFIQYCSWIESMRGAS